MHRIVLDTAVWSGASLFLAIGLLRTADAASASPATAYAEECGSCHVAYPAKHLSTADWSKVLGRLDRHFGVDASLDAASLAAVATHLRCAAAGTAGTTPLPRITTSQWFRGEHREIGASAWTSPAVKSASNCAACHAGAARGVYSERDLRLPAGLKVNEENEGEHEHDD